ncbi:MAG: PAS domain-containing protein, partial [Acidobacteriota bacterium]
MTNGPESGRFLNPGILPVLAQAAQLLDHSFVITTPGRDGSGHRFLFVNQAFTEMTGWTWEDVVGRSPKVLQGPDTDLEVIGQLRESLRNDEEFDGQTINYRKDGTPFVMKWHVRPIRDVRGKITHYFALQRDVSKETEEQNRTQRLLHALDQMPEAVVVVDPHGRVLKANHEALAWMDETDPDRVLDRPLWTLPGRPSALTDLHEIRTAVDRGEPSTHEYSTRNGPHGVTGPRVIQIAISPVADHHDHKIGFVVVA